MKLLSHYLDRKAMTLILRITIQAETSRGGTLIKHSCTIIGAGPTSSKKRTCVKREALRTKRGGQKPLKTGNKEKKENGNKIPKEKEEEEMGAELVGPFLLSALSKTKMTRTKAQNNSRNKTPAAAPQTET